MAETLILTGLVLGLGLVCVFLARVIASDVSRQGIMKKRDQD